MALSHKYNGYVQYIFVDPLTLFRRFCRRNLLVTKGAFPRLRIHCCTYVLYLYAYVLFYGVILCVSGDFRILKIGDFPPRYADKIYRRIKVTKITYLHDICFVLGVPFDCFQ